VAAVVAVFSGRIPGFEANLDPGLHSRFVSLAVVANVAYGAAYLVDIFAHMSGLRELWRSPRWILSGVGLNSCSDPSALGLHRNVPLPTWLKKPLQPSFGASHSRGFNSISCSHLADGFGEIISHCTFGKA
jgi:hypothetical protein